jgi:hypothetical protein
LLVFHYWPEEVAVRGGEPCGPLLSPVLPAQRSESLTPSTHPRANHNVVSPFIYRGHASSWRFPPQSVLSCGHCARFQVRQLPASAALGMSPFIRIFSSALTPSSSELVQSHGPSSSRSVLRVLSRPLISHNGIIDL